MNSTRILVLAFVGWLVIMAVAMTLMVARLVTDALGVIL